MICLIIGACCCRELCEDPAGPDIVLRQEKNTVTKRKICDTMEERRTEMLKLIKICCPVCGKRLFDADSSAAGIISAYCKRCKAAQLIRLTDGQAALRKNSPETQEPDKLSKTPLI